MLRNRDAAVSGEQERFLLFVCLFHLHTNRSVTIVCDFKGVMKRWDYFLAGRQLIPPPDASLCSHDVTKQRTTGRCDCVQLQPAACRRSAEIKTETCAHQLDELHGGAARKHLCADVA